MSANGKDYYYLFNHHGDIIALTDGSGEVVASYSYDAWGNILSQSGPMATENPYHYAGYRYDENTKLYYLMARYYNPDNGVFLSVDPVRGSLADPLTLNGYSYVSNNPVNFDDPTGTVKKPSLKDDIGTTSINGAKNYRSAINFSGNGKNKPLQNHHYGTNKSKKYTPQIESITKKYKLDLDDTWNKEYLPHQGRHPNAYHDYVLDNLRTFDNLAKGNRVKFLKIFEGLKSEIPNNPRMLYKDYWRLKFVIALSLIKSLKLNPPLEIYS